MCLWNISTVARRKVYLFLFAITCLFLVHFKVSQDYLVLSSVYTYRCPSCIGQHSKHNSDGDPGDILILNKSSNNSPFHLLVSRGNSSLLTNQETISVHKTNSRIKTLSNSNNGPELIRDGAGTLNDNDRNSSGDFQRLAHSITITENYNSKFASFDEAGSFKVKGTVLPKTTTIAPFFAPPANEGPQRRFPQCIIIGFPKCGTRALIDFLGLHPYVVHTGPEMHFYDLDENFIKGFDWYKGQMPLSYSNQITVEKTPAYIMSQRARDEIHKLTPDVKLIVLVRDPVMRLVSQFLLRYRFILKENDVPVTAIYRDKFTGEFNPEYKPVVKGIYHRHFGMWLEKFPRQQFLILNSEKLTTDPLSVMKRVELFLGIPALFQKRNFYFNETSGFFCSRAFDADAQPQCLGNTKGYKHPRLPADDEKMLYEFYRPLNERFFEQAGERFVWKERHWINYQ